MQKENSLVKAYKSGRLKLIEPNVNLMSSYRRKADDYLKSARLLMDNDKLEEAVSILYYSMYYAALSLLFRIGIKSESHFASIMILKEVFGLETELILHAKKERIEKQYYVDFEISKGEVLELLRSAESFNSKLLEFT